MTKRATKPRKRTKAEPNGAPPLGIANAAQLEVERAAGRVEGEALGVQRCRHSVTQRMKDHNKKGFWRLGHVMRADECADILTDFEGLH